MEAVRMTPGELIAMMSLSGSKSVKLSQVQDALS